jgi:hypothetical protein
MTTKEKMNTYRTTAIVVGVLYLAGMVIGITGSILIQSILGKPDSLAAVSANSVLLAFGAVLWLMTVVGDAAHGVLMFPVLKPHNERIAVGYLGFRIVDAVFIAVMVLFVLLQIPLSSEYLQAAVPGASYLQALSTVFTQVNQYSYHIGMAALGISCLMLCYTLYRAQLVPRWVAVWGIIGYATILCGSVVEILGFDLYSLETIPGGLWELFIGVWLIAKGFSSRPLAAQPTRSSSPAEPLLPLPEPAVA